MYSFEESVEQNQFRKFDIEKQIESNTSILISGKRMCGKTCLVLNIAKSLINSQKIDKCYVFSTSDVNNEYYRKNLKTHFIHNEEEIKDIMHTQTINKSNNESKKILIILDDCHASIPKSSTFKDLIYNSRNCNITLIVSMQYLYHFDPSLRSNFDVIFLFRENIITNKAKIYNNYCEMFDTFELFDKTFDEITKNEYLTMVIKNNFPTKDIYNKIFYYKLDYAACETSD